MQYPLVLVQLLLRDDSDLLEVGKHLGGIQPHSLYHPLGQGQSQPVEGLAAVTLEEP